MYTLLGFRRVSFVNQQGVLIEGTRIYVGSENRHVTGIKTDTYFISDKDIDLPDVGMPVDLYFNAYNKPIKVIAG